MKDGAKLKNRLRELRNRSRLTMEEVGMITGYNITTISRHENGGRSLTEEAIEKYASLYKVPTHQLFIEPLTGEDDSWMDNDDN